MSHRPSAPAGAPGMASTPEAAPLPRVGIAAIVRNEGPYLLEWLAYHRALGVRVFHIADNVSQDGTSELLAALHALGLVRRRPFPTVPGTAPQLPAYAALLADCQAEAEVDWVALIDADEFIVPTGAARTLAAALAPQAARGDVGAVALNWSVYGSSWLLNHSAGLVTERFVRRAHPDFGANHHYKSIVRLAALAGVGSNPHHFALRPGWQTVHADGSPLVDHARHGRGLSERVVWDTLRLNHYVVKSREEFDTRKSRNGSAAKVGRVKGEAYFQAHDSNDAREPLAAGLMAALQVELRGLQARLQAAGVALPPVVSAAPRYAPPFRGTLACVDEATWTAEGLALRGWALEGSGRAPARLILQAGDQRVVMGETCRRPRHDVQQHFPMADLQCGFEAVVPLANRHTPPELRLALYAGPDDGALSGPFTVPQPAPAVAAAQPA